MARVILKLTKIVNKKYLQITSLMNKVEALTQNTIESSPRLIHHSKVASLSNAPKVMSLGDAPHMSKMVQVEKQTVESTSMASLSVQQFQDMITNTIRAVVWWTLM